MSDQINQEELIPNQSENKCTKRRSKRSKVILSIVIIVITIFTIKGIVFARHLHKFADGPGEFLIEKISENLNLDAAQIAQLERIKEEIKTKMEANKPNRDNMFEDLANEFKKDNMDKNKMKELSEQKEKQMQEMKDFMMDKIIEFHNILTPEQRNKTVESMKDMKGKFHERMENFKDRKN